MSTLACCIAGQQPQLVHPRSGAARGQPAAPPTHLLLDVDAVHVHEDVADHLHRLVVQLPLGAQRAQEALALGGLDAGRDLRAGGGRGAGRELVGAQREQGALAFGGLDAGRYLQRRAAGHVRRSSAVRCRRPTGHTMSPSSTTASLARSGRAGRVCAAQHLAGMHTHTYTLSQTLCRCAVSVSLRPLYSRSPYLLTTML